MGLDYFHGRIQDLDPEAFSDLPDNPVQNLAYARFFSAGGRHGYRGPLPSFLVPCFGDGNIVARAQSVDDGAETAPLGFQRLGFREEEVEREDSDRRIPLIGRDVQPDNFPGVTSFVNMSITSPGCHPLKSSVASPHS